MYVKFIIFFLALESIDIIYTGEVETNKLIQNICDTLHKNNSLDVNEDQQWKIICEGLSHIKDGNQYTKGQHKHIDEQIIPQNKQIHKAVARGGSSIRGGSIRGGSGIRTGGSGSISGSRTSSSITRYRNTRTGTTISRPNGWQWSRSRLIFLPIATRFLHRSRSSSSRFTTPSSGSETYYYCTSTENPSVEIQCSSMNGDAQCCEEETNGQAFCCGGDIPNHILQDMNRATQTIARVFYTLAAFALCMHLFTRYFYQ